MNNNNFVNLEPAMQKKLVKAEMKREFDNFVLKAGFSLLCFMLIINLDIDWLNVAISLGKIILTLMCVGTIGFGAYLVNYFVRREIVKWERRTFKKLYLK